MFCEAGSLFYHRVCFRLVSSLEYPTSLVWDSVQTAQDENSYSAILYNLLESILSWDFVNEHKDEDCIGSIYDCEGPFSFRIYDEEDDDE